MFKIALKKQWPKPISICVRNFPRDLIFFVSRIIN